MRSSANDLISFIHISIDCSAKAGPIIRNFNQNWKKSLEQINSEVMRSFTNFMNGTNILQVRNNDLFHE